MRALDLRPSPASNAAAARAMRARPAATFRAGAICGVLFCGSAGVVACSEPEPTVTAGDAYTSPCAADEVEVDGRCLPDEAPTGWICGPALYNASDGCHCDCGAPDPDCDRADQELIGCEDLVDATCSEWGRCQGDLPPVWQCPGAYRDAGDGCDCGCAAPDPDCPAEATLADCARDNCGAGEQIDPSDVRACVPMTGPPGWSCVPALLEDGWCTCGCGADDPECPAAYTVDNCLLPSQCPFGEEPDPADPALCISSNLPPGWTCTAGRLENGFCDCGCGATDPECPVGYGINDCVLPSNCAADEDFDPFDPAICLPLAPALEWSCDLGIYFAADGCDCGCGARDPDCPPTATVGDCGTLNCGVDEELHPDDVRLCWELCTPDATAVGDATCTSGTDSAVGGECALFLETCSDGHTYAIECSDGECVCRYDGQCVAHASGDCSINLTCGWSLVDERS